MSDRMDAEKWSQIQQGGTFKRKVAKGVKRILSGATAQENCQLVSKPSADLQIPESSGTSKLKC